MNAQPESSEQGDIRYLALVCGVATLGGLLFGYDTAVIAGAIGFLQAALRADAGHERLGRLERARWVA